jgi:hypothetical protein
MSRESTNKLSNLFHHLALLKKQLFPKNVYIQLMLENN